MKQNTNTETQTCPKCQSPLSPVEELPSGKQLQRCSKGSWNPETRKTEGCDFVRWITPEPEKLDEKCPKCGKPLVMAVTRFGKKLKKCSSSGWDSENKKATGCDYVEWINGTKEELDEACPLCGSKLLLVTTASNKKMKKCSTGGWDPKKKAATGCTYVEWQSNRRPTNGDENFPDFEN